MREGWTLLELYHLRLQLQNNNTDVHIVLNVLHVNVAPFAVGPRNTLPFSSFTDCKFDFSDTSFLLVLKKEGLLISMILLIPS